MTKTAIAICTYRRPDGLARALASLEKIKLASPEIMVVVVDNDPDGSAENLVTRLAVSFPHPLSYFAETRKGLANARNAALTYARQQKIERLAFIDDDEMASEGWLQSLLDTMDETRATLVAGPTYPLFQAPPTNWTPIPAYAYIPHFKGLVAVDASSANILIDLEKVAFGFDPVFNESGGEDTEFVARILKSGGDIGWAPGAIVWDAIPVERMQAKWLLRRWFRTGVTEAKIEALRSSIVGGRVRNLSRGLVRVGFGSLRVIVGAASAISSGPAKLVASGYTICRGVGYLAGAIGRSYTEYSPARYR